MEMSGENEDADNPWQAEQDGLEDVECPNCGGKIERFEIEESGEVTCPHCGREFDAEDTG